jgi:hypothetical protein
VSELGNRNRRSRPSNPQGYNELRTHTGNMKNRYVQDHEKQVRTGPTEIRTVEPKNDKAAILASLSTAADITAKRLKNS